MLYAIFATMLPDFPYPEGSRLISQNLRHFAIYAIHKDNPVSLASPMHFVMIFGQKSRQNEADVDTVGL